MPIRYLNTHETYCTPRTDPLEIGSRCFRVIREFSPGFIACVYEVEESNIHQQPTRQRRAAKVAKQRDHDHLIQVEHDMLRQISQIYAGQLRFPVPGQAEIVTLDIAGELVPTLLMELMQDDETPFLALLYRQRRQLARTEAERLDAEALLWDAALQYVELLEVLICDIKKISKDRKPDTFRWHLGTQRLVVMDWNQISDVRDTQVQQDVSDLLRNLGQNWFYTFVDHRDQPSFDHWLDDHDRWGNISLASRYLIRLLCVPSDQKLGDLVAARQEVANWLDLMRDPAKLPTRLEKAQIEWESLKNENAQKEQVHSHYLQVLMIADLARLRLGLPYKAMAEKLSGDVQRALRPDRVPLDSRTTLEVMQELLVPFEAAGGLGEKRLSRLVKEAIEIVERFPRYREQYDFNLRDILAQLYDLCSPYSPAGLGCSYDLRSRLEMLNKNLLQAGLSVQQLPEMRRQVEFYVTLLESQAAIVRGENALAIDKINQIQRWLALPDFDDFRALCEELGLNITLGSLADLKARLQAPSSPQRPLLKLLDTLHDSLNNPDWGSLNLNTWRQKLQQAEQSQILSHDERRLLFEYEQLFNTMELFEHETGTNEETLGAGLYRLNQLIERFPGLSTWASQTAFVRSAEEYYKRLKAKYEETRSRNDLVRVRQLALYMMPIYQLPEREHL